MINPALVQRVRQEIIAMRESLGDDDNDLALREDMIEGETDIDIVMSRLARVRIAAKANAHGANEARKQAVSHYDRREAIAEREIQSCDKIIQLVLNDAGQTKFKTPEGSISIQQGRISLVLADNFEPPQGYRKTTITPDKAAIKALLDDGGKLDGAELVRGAPFVTVR